MGKWKYITWIEQANSRLKAALTGVYIFHQRLAARRGRKRALVAVAHRILTAAYYILLKGEPYRDLGVNYRLAASSG